MTRATLTGHQSGSLSRARRPLHGFNLPLTIVPVLF
jgi:hypothetical protein